MITLVVLIIVGAAIITTPILLYTHFEHKEK